MSAAISTYTGHNAAIREQLGHHTPHSPECQGHYVEDHEDNIATENQDSQDVPDKAKNRIHGKEGRILHSTF